ncbi:MAG: FecR domain-containing protein [Azonexus sp.]|nr:FecR domain-containing protein [Azonexus sp.]MCK6411537.1 FecR domain-containing protein [Azonexus sp.]
MIPRARFSTIALSVALALPAAAHAQEGATVLFSQSGSLIVNPAGDSRPATRGERLQTGERLITPANAISQIKLSDGSLIGVRPGSELSIGTENRQQTISLQQGAVRVIAAELIKPQAKSQLVVQTPQTRVELKAADIETAVVRPRAGNQQAGEGGSYSRLQTGSASMQTPAGGMETLSPGRTAFIDNGGRLTREMPGLPAPARGEAQAAMDAKDKPPSTGRGKPGEPPALVPQLNASAGAPRTQPLMAQGMPQLPPNSAARPPEGFRPPPGQGIGLAGATSLARLPQLPPPTGTLPGTPPGRPPGIVPGPGTPPKPPQPGNPPPSGGQPMPPSGGQPMPPSGGQPMPPSGGQPMPPSGGQPMPPSGGQPMPPSGGQPMPPSGGQPMPPSGGQPMPPSGGQPLPPPAPTRP